MKYALILLTAITLNAHANTIIDQDLLQRKNLEIVKHNGIKNQYYYLNIGKERYVIGIYEKHPIGNIRYLALHDSEDAAFDGGLDAIKNGGLMVVLENNEQRYLFERNKNKTTDIDPNRIFMPESQYFALGQSILSHLKLSKNSVIVSLHNNSPNSGFGMNNIKKYGATDISCKNDTENKNLYWLPYNASNKKNVIALADNLCKKNTFNVVLENVPPIGKGDGSLSIYAGNKDYKYINIEIKAGIKNNSKSEKVAKENQVRYINGLLEATKSK